MASEEVEVFRGAATPGRREFLEAVLREKEIRFVVRSEGAIAAHPLTAGPMGEFVILVSAEDAPRAVDLLQSLEHDPVDTVASDEEEDSSPELALGIRPPSPRAKKAYFWTGVASALFGAWLLAQWPSPAVIFGFLILFIWAPLMIARSR